MPPPLLSVEEPAPPAEGSLPQLADPVSLQQALTALLCTAVERTPGQPVHLTVSIGATSSRVRFDVWNGGAMERITPPDAAFEPFVSTKRGRLGVGLSMARRIEAHGGTLYLIHTSTEDGTCFAMRLPSRPTGAEKPIDADNDRTHC